MNFVFSGHDLRKWERHHEEWGHNNSREFIKAVLCKKRTPKVWC